MKIALLSDIHGNSVALDAVLADIANQGGADHHWLLGDLVALGPDPVGVLERLSRLPSTQFVRGNTDRYVATGERPPPLPDHVVQDFSLLPQLLEVTRTFAWTQGALAATGWLDWLKQLPLEITFRLPNGSLLLGVHASPGQDDGPGLHPQRTDDELERLVAGCDAGIICAGHTHQPFVRKLGTREIVNLGSVSLSSTADKRASYVLLRTSPTENQLTPRKVAYDTDRVIRQLEERDHPGRDFIIRHLRG